MTSSIPADWRFVLCNLLAFQACWWALVLQADDGPWWGLAILLPWAALHFRLADRPRRDLWLVLIVAPLGPLVDLTIAQLGLMQYRGPAPLAGLPPYWIFALWGGFALTLRHSLRTPLAHPALALVFGAVGGPMAYYGGTRFGAGVLGEPLLTALLGMAVVWGLATLSLQRLVVRSESWT